MICILSCCTHLVWIYFKKSDQFSINADSCLLTGPVDFQCKLGISKHLLLGGLSGGLYTSTADFVVNCVFVCEPYVTGNCYTDLKQYDINALIGGYPSYSELPGKLRTDRR